ncbi:MAG: glycyl radical protein [Bacillota bacterium]
MTKRTQRLRNELLDTTPEICTERARYFTESMKKSEGSPIVLRRAESFKEVLENMSIYIRPGELIVGNQASSPRSAPVFPEYSVEWIEEELNGEPYYFNERPNDDFNYTKKTENELREIIDYWQGKTVLKNLKNLISDEAKKAWDMGAIDEGWVSEGGLGNILPDYEIVLENGLNGYIKKAENELSKLDLKEPGAVKKKWFLDSVIKTNKAVIDFSHRFAEKLENLSAEVNDQHRKTELLEMVENCRVVPAEKPKTFWQAVQAVWFVHLAIQIETNGHAISLGRFDQYLYPYYQADLKAGRITAEKAQEIIESFFIKANEVNKLRPWGGAKFFPGYHMAENLAIGGQTIDGKDAVNELTYLVLNATEEMGLPKPSVSLKWFEGTDEEFMHRALEVVDNHSGGQPALYNDLGVMRILKNMGIKDDDLHNWAPVGCIEASIPGKWDFAAKGAWINTAKIFELTINNGKDPESGIQILKGEGKLSDFKNMNEIMKAFKKQLHYYMDLAVEVEHMNDEVHKQHDINAFRSSLIEDCIGRAKSLIEGGSIYSADGGPTVGAMSAGDSLAAIETAVFDNNWITLEELEHALETNFEDIKTTPTGPEIQELLKNKTPKFGNDNDKADKWTVEINDFMGSTMHNEYKNSRYGEGPVPGTYSLSQSSVTGNVAFGNFVGALPNGRKAKKPINNGVSPSTGAERNGAVAAINSVSKLPSIWFQKGAIFNIRLSPSTLKTVEGKKRVYALVKTLFQNKQYHVQFNVVGTETLLDAQKNPENYRDLMVRVAGYSAFFAPLNDELQEDIIQRTKFEEETA